MLTDRRPLRVAVLCSQRAPGVSCLVDDATHGSPRFEIVCVVTSEDRCDDQPEVERRGVPVLSHSIRRYCDRRGVSVYRDFGVREDYDHATVRLLEPFEPDLLLFSGYLYIATDALLTCFGSRVLNLHLSDLALRLPDGRPRFPGLRAVRDAVAAGQPATSATVHFVTRELDAGAPIVRSWPFIVSPLVAEARAWGADDMVKAYAFAHQQWMLRSAAGPLWLAALRLIAAGEVDLDALALADASRVEPWTLDRCGRLQHPWRGEPHRAEPLAAAVGAR